MLEPEPTYMSIRQDIPYQGVLRNLLSMNIGIFGGLPLYLTGYAPFYSDIDIYPISLNGHLQAKKFLSKLAKTVKITPKTKIYNVYGVPFQLVDYFDTWKSKDDILYTTDVSVSACELLWDNEFKIRVLYPDDLKNKLCRVFIKHSWTWHRIETYKKKGFKIIEDIIIDETQGE